MFLPKNIVEPNEGPNITVGNDAHHIFNSAKFNEKACNLQNKTD